MSARRSWLACRDHGGAKIEVSLAASTAVSSAVVTTATLPSRRRQQPSKWRAQGLWPARRYRGGRGDRGVATIAASVLGGFLDGSVEASVTSLKFSIIVEIKETTMMLLPFSFFFLYLFLKEK